VFSKTTQFDGGEVKYLKISKDQKNTQLSFWWKAKSSSYKIAFEEFIIIVGSAANSVGTTLKFAAFGRGPDAK